MTNIERVLIIRYIDSYINSILINTVIVTIIKVAFWGDFYISQMSVSSVSWIL